MVGVAQMLKTTVAAQEAAMMTLMVTVFPIQAMLALMTTLIHQMTQTATVVLMTTAETEMVVAQALQIQITME